MLTSREMLDLAYEFESQAVVLVEHMRGGFPRTMTAEAADLFGIAAGLRIASGASEEPLYG